MRAIGLVFLVANVCIHFATPSKHNLRKTRAWIVNTLSMEEEQRGPFPYKLGDLNTEKNVFMEYSIHGQGIDRDPKGILSIDKTDGSIYVHGKVDYEEYNKLTITFESDKSPDSKLAVDIEILDVNDHTPVFNNPVYESTIDESTTQGEHVVTIFASDGDRAGSANSLFTFRIVSVTPTPSNAEFFIRQTEGDTTGEIYFKGCLNYEEAQKYTIVVEAKDHGEKVQLSSTSRVIVNVIDKNNHLPEFVGKMTCEKVKEGQRGEPVCRLQVADKDSTGSAAWRAKYSLQGEQAQHFKIKTDPLTNDGVITVTKPLDYEERSSLKLTVSVENEDPFFYCRVKRRPKHGLWNIENSRGRSISTSVSLPINIIVEDVNDPPIFIENIKHVRVMENMEIGHSLWMFKAEDQDHHDSNSIMFTRGEDVDDWVTVDSQTGLVSTAKILDRESPYVKDNTYTVVLYAVDNGTPPMTGTGTLIIHLRDENDNSPMLEVDKQYMCFSERAIEITAVDPDLHPYSAPFRFELVGDVDGKWKLNSNYGTNVTLFKEGVVPVGDHELTLKISDSQGQFSLQTLSVHVCECTITAECVAMQLSVTAIIVIVISILILLGFLLMSCLIRHMPKKTRMIQLEGSSQSFIPSHTEAFGTDCKIPFIYTDSLLTKASSSDITFSDCKYKDVGNVKGCSDEHGVLEPCPSLEADVQTDIFCKRDSNFTSVKLQERFKGFTAISHTNIKYMPMNVL
ncbi:cadherin-like protein 26 isoform X2 [Xyrauchen texanus]|uniref:cadherin-like protein 26 isoform X2 n=1 Tax=Xyrauchen texanus TaxID=154827 RepID=UPI0022428FD6|nr:cadherin-like protein 26 isoform X2 [Xyrauchen texanus]